MQKSLSLWIDVLENVFHKFRGKIGIPLSILDDLEAGYELTPEDIADAKVSLTNMLDVINEFSKELILATSSNPEEECTLAEFIKKTGCDVSTAIEVRTDMWPEFFNLVVSLFAKSKDSKPLLEDLITESKISFQKSNSSQVEELINKLTIEKKFYLLLLQEFCLKHNLKLGISISEDRQLEKLEIYI